jgi:hypothetical protein
MANIFVKPKPSSNVAFRAQEMILSTVLASSAGAVDHCSQSQIWSFPWRYITFGDANIGQLIQPQVVCSETVYTLANRVVCMAEQATNETTRGHLSI